MKLRHLDSDDEEGGQLHAACRAGTIKDIEDKLGQDPESINQHQDGMTPLHVAVTRSRHDVCDVVSLLLDKGADIDAQTTDDANTALHLTVLYGKFPKEFDVVVIFLEKKANLSIRNKKLRTPYDCAIANDQIELAEVLEGSIDPEQAKDYYIRRLGERYGPKVIEAVLESDDRNLRKYLDMGGDPNMLNKHGAGAIHYAVGHCRLPVYDTLLVLLHAGTKVDLQDEEEDTALNLVIKAKELRDNGQMTRCVQLLADTGANSDIKDIDGKDAIVLATDRGYDDVLAILKGPQVIRTPTPAPKDVNSPNEDGYYPIHVAAMIEEEDDRDIQVETLVGEGAKVDSQAVPTGDTALHICAKQDYGSTAVYLLDNHIDYTLKNLQGKTAYEIAEDNNSTSVMAAIDEKQGHVQDRWKKAGRKAKWCTIL